MTQRQIDAVASPGTVRDGLGLTPAETPVVGSLVQFTAENVEDQLRRIAEHVKNSPTLPAIARILGLTYFVGDVSVTEDTQFTHQMTRQPCLVVFSVSLDGGDGRVCGSSIGGLNTTTWSMSSIFVRATTAGRYAFMVI